MAYLAKSKDIENNFDFSALKMLITKLLEIHKSNNNLFLIGNGGSASTAQHFCTDLGIGSYYRKNPIRAVSLVDNTAIVTAVSNDLQFESVFETQIGLLARKGDLLLALSASGNSMNLVKAFTIAKSLGLTTASMTGFDGGILKNISDISLHFQTRLGEYGIVEDAHLRMCHFITEFIRSVET
jgi:D-sedoheptulose 7-phosphate isomerase